MNKLIFLCFYFIVCSVSAQELFRFQATRVYARTADEDWKSQECDIFITINTADDVIHIYTETRQRYDIISSVNEFIDDDGDSIKHMDVLDQDGDECSFRIIVRKDGQLQLQILYDDRYDNATWVYDVRKKT